MEFLHNEDTGKLIVRVMVSVLILFHGVSKLMDISGTVSWLGSTLAGYGLPEFIAYGVYLGEVVGPLMVLFGVFSRIGGALIAINMLFAIGLVHLGHVFALNDHGALVIQADLFFLLSAVAVMFLGSGRYAVYED